MADGNGKAANPVVFFDVSLGGKHATIAVMVHTFQLLHFTRVPFKLLYSIQHGLGMVKCRTYVDVFQESRWVVSRWSSSRM